MYSDGTEQKDERRLVVEKGDEAVGGGGGIGLGVDKLGVRKGEIPGALFVRVRSCAEEGASWYGDERG